MATRDSSRPISSVLTEVISEVAYLLQTEIRLARAEIGEKVGQAANGGAFLGIAAVISIPGIFILLLALVRWLEVAGVPDQWGLLLVGLVVLGGAVALALKGINNLKASALVPERTIKQVGADFSIAKERVK
jgi:Putative Actinobacterial Holin-X, holin superfamily III